MQDLSEITVNNSNEMFSIFKQGVDNRKISFTKMNAGSSRSHSIFIIRIAKKDIQSTNVKHGKLYLIDLAGSERLSKTGVEGVGLEEAKNINKSLLSLGNVINALTEGSKYVSYRDSKLTRLLQEALGGNSLTTLIITLSMSSFNDKESLSTLRFGSRAKEIKNSVSSNETISSKELMIKLTNAENKIKNFGLPPRRPSVGGEGRTSQKFV